MGRNANQKRSTRTLIALLIALGVQAQPKLVVQVVVDQMRAEYLQRFSHQFSEDGGFQILLEDGMVFRNTHYNYIPTYTGPGHASISTGTTPKYHGVVANDWWVRESNYQMYCAEDTTVNPIGTIESSSRRSPRNLKALTFSDGIKLFTNNRGKSYGVSVKDRGAIFPAGHFADGALWLDNKLHFVTSSYYGDELPDYVEKFNEREYAMDMAKKDWKLEMAKRKYDESLPDENPYEPKLNKGTSSFPYDLKKLIQTNGLDALKNTPIGNELVLEMALKVLQKEELGKDKYTDFLGISFSSTDYAGHTFGVRSREVHDMYLKLDRQLGKLIKELDDEIGREDYVLYLTADHGASENPNQLAFHGLNVRNYQNADVIGDLNLRIDSMLGIENAVFKIFNHHIHLNKWAKEYAAQIALIVESSDPFMRVYTASEVRSCGNDDLLELLHEGHQSRFGGDLVFSLQPNCIFYGPYGSTHGSGFLYDTHVPFILLGLEIEPSESFEKIPVSAIVDKVAELSKLPFAPNSLIH